ncbi:hypothetical protein GSS88_02705 [Corynebacterium sp. 3HC-13]|uniref:hypothetical protein n=1 Tax=Corynebacterium poyangense TaxID=2684405 RepID=UPI001CC8FB7D|nr:hypothetical protein [Corynebacterium poyangense]MBZ8176709.1 hypothetical protein [Corynebacterium poyangense]
MKKTLFRTGAIAVSAALLVSCSAQGGDSATSSSSVGSSASESSSAPTTPNVEAPGKPAQLAEVRHQTPRVALSYDGGVMVLDAGNLEKGEAPKVVKELDKDGYLRLNSAGDDRHVFVSTGKDFEVLDIGSYHVPHGDHSHYYAGDPSFTGFKAEGAKPGHVTTNGKKAVLFDDETGDVTTINLEDFTVADAFQVPPHHGIGHLNEDGTYMVTIADKEGKRIGVAQVKPDGTEIKRFEQCPDAHGAKEAADGALFVGCTDGGLIYKDGNVTKVKAPDAYGRIGNQAGSKDSKYILGDYKTDKKAAEEEKLERPERVSIIDTSNGDIKLVDLGTSYTFRSLAMTDEGQAVVLGTDGSLHIIDPEQGKVVKTINVISPWKESETWQDPRPALSVQGNAAYVTDPATNTLHVIDLKGEKEAQKVELPRTPDEIVISEG